MSLSVTSIVSAVRQTTPGQITGAVCPRHGQIAERSK